ncbi:uncharacterized protein LOC129965394 [Argiope bruennichi]|uniref:uncharacterized protein LOC129965394 n=1 Tax=Argiope bruennichi TaxID=94029 RepID=UPI0024945AC5|nr:uncharacterized protein LOC129965394 [Argiope bruennichi]
MIGHPMRREEYERTYGRRSHHLPPPMAPPPQEDPRSRRSRTKMKCLISIGLILPALAAVIGVAAWAVSADVVMNSGNNRPNKADNHLLQNFAEGTRRDIFRVNDDSQRVQIQPSPQTSSTTTTIATTSTSTTTTSAPTLSPQEETDVNAILSKLISASGAAAGGNGPRFVVVAPLPDSDDSSPISRADNPSSTKPSSKEDNSQPVRSHSREDSSWQVSGKHRPEPEIISAASYQSYQKVLPPVARSASSSNLTSRVGLPNNDGSNRRMGPKPIMMPPSGSVHNGGSGFHNPQIDLTGFEPFDTMMHDFQASQSVQKQQQNPPPSNFGGSFNSKRGPPQGHFNRNQHKPLGMQQDQHIFHHHMPEHSSHVLQGSSNHPQGMMAPPPGIGLKPIQQQLHHVDPLRPEESNRWGSVGFHGPPSGGYVHKPPEGISVAISSPAGHGAHVSSEPVSVIKSFFLPFLPKPRLNMNARVVFGVVLDKGMGIGADKKKSHPYR